MGSPRFVSPGAMGGNAIEQFLMQRELEKRQQLEQQFRQQQAEAQATRQAEELALRQQQEARIAQAQTEQQANLEKERQFRRASTIATTGLPGTLDAETAGLLKGEGFGTLVTQGQPTQGADLGVDEQGVNQYDVLPGVLQFAGGSQYQAAKAQREASAANAEATRQSAEERARESNDTRMEIARLAAQGANSSRELTNEMTRLRIEGERTKQETAATERTKAASAVGSGRQRIRDLAQSLIDDPALDSVTGMIEGRRNTFLQSGNVDAVKRLKQLVDSLSVEERSKLKGQGQVSNFEAQMLANAVSAIDRAAGPDIVRKHLKEIVDTFQGDAPNEQSAETPEQRRKRLYDKYK